MAKNDDNKKVDEANFCKHLPDDKVQQLYQLLKDIVDCFSDSDVMMWAEGGTLLGAVRDHGLIAHDDDVDIGLFASDVDKFKEKTEPLLERAGYKVMEWGFGFKIFNPKGDEIPDKPFKFPFCDVFIVDWKDGHTWYPKSHEAWENCHYYRGEMLPLSRADFGPISVPVGKTPSAYLNRCYGKDWESKSQCGKDHATYASDKGKQETLHQEVEHSHTTVALPKAALVDHEKRLRENVAAEPAAPPTPEGSEGSGSSSGSGSEEDSGGSGDQASSGDGEERSDGGSNGDMGSGDEANSNEVEDETMSQKGTPSGVLNPR